MPQVQRTYVAATSVAQCGITFWPADAAKARLGVRGSDLRHLSCHLVRSTRVGAVELFLRRGVEQFGSSLGS